MGNKAIQDEFTGQGTAIWRWQQRQKKKGLCQRDTNKVTPGSNYCLSCQQYYREYARKKRKAHAVS
jgi:hypothetical protein